MKVLLDTNILMLSEKFKIDIFFEIERLANSECKFYTLQSVVNELLAISKTTGKKSLQAKTALSLLRNKKVEVLNYIDYPDQVFENIDGYVIATNDLRLARKLKKNGKRVIFLRQKKHFEIY